MKRKLLCIAAALSTLFAAASVQGASVQTPDGNMPLIHWAVVESTDGQMSVLQQLGAKHVAPEVAKEGGWGRSTSLPKSRRKAVPTHCMAP